IWSIQLERDAQGFLHRNVALTAPKAHPYPAEVQQAVGLDMSQPKLPCHVDRALGPPTAHLIGAERYSCDARVGLSELRRRPERLENVDGLFGCVHCISGAEPKLPLDLAADAKRASRAARIPAASVEAHRFLSSPQGQTTVT